MGEPYSNANAKSGGIDCEPLAVCRFRSCVRLLRMPLSLDRPLKLCLKHRKLRMGAATLPIPRLGGDHLVDEGGRLLRLGGTVVLPSGIRRYR